MTMSLRPWWMEGFGTRGNRLFVNNFVDDGGDALARERLFAGENFVEQDAEGEDVAAAVDGAAFDLFGRHVTGRAHNVGGLLNSAELQNFGTVQQTTHVM